MEKENKIGEENQKQEILDFNASEIKEKIKQKLEDINKIYNGLSQDYQDGVDEGLKVALGVIRKEEMVEEDILKQGEIK